MPTKGTLTRGMKYIIVLAVFAAVCLILWRKPGYISNFQTLPKDLVCKSEWALEADNKKVEKVFTSDIPTTPEKGPNKIPRIIIQTNEKTRIPSKMLRSIETILDDNPEYKYLYFTNGKARDFIRKHFSMRVVNAYDKLKPGAYKADLFRYCALYILGGVYIDTGMVSKAPLRSMIKKDDVFISPEDDGTKGIYNAFICCAPKSQIMDIAIRLVVKNVESNSYGHDPLVITGPLALAKALKMYLKSKGRTHGAYIPKPDETIVPGIRIIKYVRTGFCYTEGEISDGGNYLFLSRYPGYYQDRKWYYTNKHYSAMWLDKDVYNSPLEAHQMKLLSLMRKFDKLCKKHNLTYYISDGTLLGAVREKRIIPWDDDIDVHVPKSTVEFLTKNKDALDAYDLALRFQDHIWRIYDPQDLVPYLDLFEVEPKEDGKIHYKEDANIKRWPNGYFMEYEIFPLKKYKFGPLALRGPADPIPYLVRMYKDWKTPVKWKGHFGLQGQGN
jgi:phosphorylcholine metabolism protein LicD